MDTGIRTPSHTSPNVAVSDNQVPFTVKLEPLHFGILPASVIPTLLAILFVTAVSAFFVVPKILGAFERIGSKAAEELRTSGTVEKTQ